MKFLLSLSFYIFISTITFAQKFKIENEPEWIKKIDNPSKSLFQKYDIALGYYLTLADYQFNLDKNEYYSHTVNNVISYTGITKASQLSIVYDTSYQNLQIHHLYIWRNGQRIVRTSDLKFQIIHNEHELQNGIYTGLITAYSNLNDIRKEDLIDFAYTLKGKNPIFKNEKYLFIPLEQNNPVEKLNVRILYNKSYDYTYNCENCNSNEVVTSNVIGNYKELQLSLSNTKSLNIEENIPTYTIPFKYLILTSFKSWKKVNEWAEDIFSVGEELNSEIIFKDIFNGQESIDEKIDKIINFVQDDIRYMGIETGIGSIKPSSPNQVIKRRFGDCKDKSLLLVTLLKKIGVNKAYPVLVNTYLKQELSKFRPSNEIFNHCIVKFIHNDSTYWVDPTFTQQGGSYKQLAITDYGHVFEVGLSSDSLTKMNLQKSNSTIDITDIYHIKSFTDSVELEIKSVRKGYEADIRRYLIEQNTSEKFAKLVFEDLKKYYPKTIKKEDVVINDEIDKNTFTTTYKFNILDLWQDGDDLGKKETAGYWIFRFEPSTVYNFLTISSPIKRKYDFAQNFPLNLTYNVIFNLPKDILVQDSYSKNENEYFLLDEKIEQLNKNSVQLSYNFKTKQPHIKAEDFIKISEEKLKIVEHLPIIFYFNK